MLLQCFPASSNYDDRGKSIKLPFAKNIMHKLSKSMHDNNFKIEERRRQVASMLAQSMTETEIAEQIECIYFLTNMQLNHNCCQHFQEFLLLQPPFSLAPYFNFFTSTIR
jgi:hypothetical protein